MDGLIEWAMWLRPAANRDQAGLLDARALVFSCLAMRLVGAKPPRRPPADRLRARDLLAAVRKPMIPLALRGDAELRSLAAPAAQSQTGLGS